MCLASLLWAVHKFDQGLKMTLRSGCYLKLSRRQDQFQWRAKSSLACSFKQGSMSQEAPIFPLTESASSERIGKS